MTSRTLTLTRSPRLLVLSAATLIQAATPKTAQAQDCGCDHTLALDQTVARGDLLGLKPGDRVCVQAGARPFLRIQRVRGSAQQPITFINCGGQAIIRNTDRAYALTIEDESEHVRVTGTGDAAHRYGFKISAPARQPYPGVGLWIQGKATNIEADHMEIHDTGFAGVMAKTDPSCDGSADQGRFTQRDVRLHHLHIHDTHGEGMYLGSTQSQGHTITCQGQRVVRQPHWLEGIVVHDVLIEDTGWDGAQIGMARSGCAFYRNTIRRVGSGAELYQQQGLQLGTFSACDVYDNVITDGPAMGIIALGAGRTRIWNNVIARFGEDGIYANDNGIAQSQGQPYVFWHNTVVDYGRRGLSVFGAQTQGSQARNNLFVGRSPALSAGRDVQGWSSRDDMTLSDVQTARLDPEHLWPLEGSPVLGQGQPLPEVTHDQRGQRRPQPPSVGALERPSSDQAPDMDAPDMDAPDMRAQEMGAADMRSADMRSADMNASDMNAPDQAGETRGPGERPSATNAGCAQARASGPSQTPSDPARAWALVVALVLASGVRRASRGRSDA